MLFILGQARPRAQRSFLLPIRAARD